MRQSIEILTRKFSDQNGADSVQKIDAAEADSSKIWAELLNVSLFAPRRLFVIKNAGEDKLFWEKLNENLPRIPDETDVIFCSKKPDKRTKTFKDLVKAAGENSREFLNLKNYEMKSWLSQTARELNIQIDGGAVDELVSATAGDSANQQARLMTELTKLATLNRAISVDDVRKFVEPNLSANAFEILNLALNSEREKAAREIEKMRNSGEDANKFLGLIASQIFALAAAVFGGENANADLAKKLKIHPFQLSSMKSLARNLSKNDVRKIARIWAETDAKMKLSRADEAWVLVEVALAKISNLK